MPLPKNTQLRHKMTPWWQGLAEYTILYQPHSNILIQSILTPFVSFRVSLSLAEAGPATKPDPGGDEFSVGKATRKLNNTSLPWKLDKKSDVIRCIVYVYLYICIFIHLYIYTCIPKYLYLSVYYIYICTYTYRCILRTYKIWDII